MLYKDDLEVVTKFLCLLGTENIICFEYLGDPNKLLYIIHYYIQYARYTYIKALYINILHLKYIRLLRTQRTVQLYLTSLVILVISHNIFPFHATYYLFCRLATMSHNRMIFHATAYESSGSYYRFFKTKNDNFF